MTPGVRGGARGPVRDLLVAMAAIAAVSIAAYPAGAGHGLHFR